MKKPCVLVPCLPAYRFMRNRPRSSLQSRNPSRLRLRSLRRPRLWPQPRHRFYLQSYNGLPYQCSRSSSNRTFHRSFR